MIIHYTQEIFEHIPLLEKDVSIDITNFLFDDNKQRICVVNGLSLYEHRCINEEYSHFVKHVLYDDANDFIAYIISSTSQKNKENSLCIYDVIINQKYHGKGYVKAVLSGLFQRGKYYNIFSNQKATQQSIIDWNNNFVYQRFLFVFDITTKKFKYIEEAVIEDENKLLCILHVPWNPPTPKRYAHIGLPKIHSKSLFNSDYIGTYIKEDNPHDIL